MRFKTLALFVLLGILGVFYISFFGGTMLLGEVTVPFHSLNPNPDSRENISVFTVKNVPDVSFVHTDALESWAPWIIKQASILIGGLSLIVFIYAGVTLIVFGDQEDQFKKSVKMIIFAVAGIGLAAFSYSMIDQVLNIFL